ncbi:MAG: 50S ribosomal protein L15 [Candidatus Hodgkinia cicadicola]|nr:MAG: 50S ribosomal protein L15 [Candidatus Hodgkinia cicadicola]
MATLNCSANARCRRVGRGASSSKGKTSGRGHKGQRARSGGSSYSLEGGQTPLHRRLPKRGFGRARLARRAIRAVSLSILDRRIRRQRISLLNIVSAHALKSLLGIKSKLQLKLLAGKPTTPNLNLCCERASAGALSAIEQLGGKLLLNTS